MGPVGRASWPPAGPSSGWVGGKINLCVVQAANTGIMAGILSVCTVQGKCRVAAHFPPTPAKTIGPRVCDPTIFNPVAEIDIGSLTTVL